MLRKGQIWIEKTELEILCFDNYLKKAWAKWTFHSWVSVTGFFLNNLWRFPVYLDLCCLLCVMVTRLGAWTFKPASYKAVEQNVFNNSITAEENSWKTMDWEVQATKTGYHFHEASNDPKVGNWSRERILAQPTLPDTGTGIQTQHGRETCQVGSFQKPETSQVSWAQIHQRSFKPLKCDKEVDMLSNTAYLYLAHVVHYPGICSNTCYGISL